MKRFFELVIYAAVFYLLCVVLLFSLIWGLWGFLVGLTSWVFGIRLIYLYDNGSLRLSDFTESISKFTNLASTKYDNLTKNFLPIQKRLFTFALVSGIAFVFFNVGAWLEFLSLDEFYERGDYLENNYIFPNPLVFGIVTKGVLGKNFFWYTDIRSLIGIVFLITVALLTVSFVVNASIDHKQK